MDEFGVLTERFGLKPQGKAAPMAAPKGPSSYVNNVQSRSSGHNHVSAPTNRSSSHSSSPSPWNANSGNDGASSDSYSDFLQSKSDNKGQSFGDLDAYGDFLRASNKSSRSSASNSGAAASFDYDSFFGSKPTSNYDNDDIFGGMPGNSLGRNDDVFATFASPPGQSSPVDDLLGGFGNGDDIFGNAGMNAGKSHGNGSAAGSTAAGFDELIPGFGGSSPPKNDSHKKKPPKSHVYSAELNSMSEDPFVLLESTSKGKFSDPLEESNQFGNFQRANDTADKVKNPSVSAIDELEKFAMGKMRRNASTESDFLSGGKRVMAPGKDSRHKEGSGAAHRNSADDLESFFSVSSRSSSVPKSRPPSSMKNKEVSKTSPARADQKGMKKASSTTNMIDDLSFMFGASSFAGEFEEIEGESEERRRARLGRHGRTQERVAKAVAEMNQRDFQTQQEQEERQRIAENLDVQIRSWAAGKEGNLRALLSSLQHVLWPECGWEPVSLTDLITSTSVKKVYRKATLCVHPDKVQQKGASLQNKYTAEKVFDILKEAWKKFDAEELR